MSDSVHVRNAKALDARNQQQQLEIDALRDRLVALEQQVAMFRSRADQQEQRVMAFIASRGVGPTS